MEAENQSTPFPDSEALFATIARLFAAEGDLLAVEVLSTSKSKFEWTDHDNWNGGFDIYTVYLEVPFRLYSKIKDTKQPLEQKILDKLQSVSLGHSTDHVQSVLIILEVTGGKDWRQKAKAWVAGDETSSDIQDASVSMKKILVQPEIFKIPDASIDGSQVAVMMPFASEFNGTYEAIKRACVSVGLKPLRADDIWSNSAFMQDIFEIIYCSRVIIVDFSKRNPNVMYETGIAHTLGRYVVPITRSIDDVPSDLQHHRALVYLPNEEGLQALTQGLTVRLSTITGREPKMKSSA